MQDSLSNEVQQETEGVEKSVFGDFMFRDLSSRRRNITRLDTTRENPPEVQNTNTSEMDISKDDDTTQKEAFSKSNIKAYGTISGNHLITRCWDDNNMCEFRLKRRRK